MKRKLRIGIRLPGLGTFDISRSGNVQGDELVARGWQKYLLRHEQVESVFLYRGQEAISQTLDVLIHFNPYLDIHTKVKNILYLQNAFSEEHHPLGTLGVFNAVKDRFDGYLFTSQKLMTACDSGEVVPFATDPEFFFPQRTSQYQHPVSFVGNSFRGPIVNQRYFVTALPFGLVIYGNNTWTLPLSTVCRGKLPMPDLPKLYSSSLINLNAHILEHIKWDTVNLRIYDILACEGFIISDYVDSIPATFGDSVICTKGDEDEWAKLVYYLSDSEQRYRRSKEGRKIVLSEHTYENRVRTVVRYLEEVI